MTFQTYDDNNYYYNDNYYNNYYYYNYFISEFEHDEPSQVSDVVTGK